MMESMEIGDNVGIDTTNNIESSFEYLKKLPLLQKLKIGVLNRTQTITYRLITSRYKIQIHSDTRILPGSVCPCIYRV